MLLGISPERRNADLKDAETISHYTAFLPRSRSILIETRSGDWLGSARAQIELHEH